MRKKSLGSVSPQFGCLLPESAQFELGRKLPLRTGLGILANTLCTKRETSWHLAVV